MINPRGFHRVASSVLPILWCALAAFTPSALAQNIVINEIMYHPASHDPREEYVEIYNAGPTNVNLSGWKFTKGINFTFPTNTFLGTADYLVVAANHHAFTNKYSTVTNVVGDYVVVRLTNVVGFTYTNFENSLSNTRDQLQLENAGGTTIDAVTYSDQGDWAIRRRGTNDGGYQGWTWFSPADGLGRSLELINPNLPNEHGQNWGASMTTNGTPGTVNSIASANTGPLIANVAHSPVIPQPTNVVAVSARVIDEAGGVTARVFWRVNNGSPPAFTSATMFDDGAHGDGAPGDGIWGALIPAQTGLSIVEFYVEAVDASNRTNSWPRPAVNTNGVTQMNRTNFSFNALYQVDSTPYTGSAPLYKLILTPGETTELGNLLAGSPNSDAEFNATFISIDAQGTEIRYLCGVRNRGHGSRTGTPHNYRIDIPADTPWHQVRALNINARTVEAQHVGSVLAQKSGAPGNTSRAVQLRINGGAGPGGTPALGHYAANEVPNTDWASNHFPSDSGGSIYSVFRDNKPSDFFYRGPASGAYDKTYFKESNASENDWIDLIALLRIMGTNDLFTAASAREVVNVDNWLLHLAFMALVDNRETGINTGHNDDYELYRGIHDPRFLLVYHDLDSILGLSGGLTNSSIFGSTVLDPGNGDTNGVGRSMTRFLHAPEFEPLYYKTLQRLLDTTFAKTNFDPVLDQTLGFYVPAPSINSFKLWMDGRRSYVQGLLNTYFVTNPPPPTATVAGEPRSPTPFATATLIVGGSNVVSYRFKLNDGSYGAETPVATPISLTGLSDGSTNRVSVMGRSAAGAWQDGTNSPTVSAIWIVKTSTPPVRLNEVLVQNNTAVNHAGTFPDVIELYNEGGTPVDVGGLRLSDDVLNPDKFTFPPDTLIAANGYLIIYANNDDGSGGLHAGFSLSASGEAVYLFDRTTDTLLDSVVFGLQLADLSVGRFGASGEWRLCTPTFPGANIARPTGDAQVLRINEWLTAGAPPFAEDFVEIYNPSSLPVNFGNCYFTDELIGAPTLSHVPPLTFIQPNSFLALKADGNIAAGADHLNFTLSSDLGQISLLDPSFTLIDSVSYGPQTPNVAQGRCPDGANHVVFLAAPSPGAGNICPPSIPDGSFGLLAYSNSWHFNQSSNLDGIAWMTTNYNDSSWASGPGAFGVGGTLVEPIRTALNSPNGRTFYYRTRFVLPASPPVTSLLLSHYIDDGAVVYLNGQEAYRYNMTNGIPVTFGTFATNFTGTPGELGPFALPLTNLFAGTNVIAVEVHQGNATSLDTFMAVQLQATTNSAPSAGVVINEVLAGNSNIQESDGSTPDWVEFYNPSTGDVDLGNASLTGDVAVPRRWVFPGGSIVPAQGYYRVFFSANSPLSATNTGFGLKDTGDSIYLFSAEGGLLDSITFGVQAMNYSIGRHPDGSTNWMLTLPTAGSPNLPANLGNVLQTKVNEWMASPLSGDDWFELYNPNSQPVAIGGHWLTDDLSTPTTRMRYQIPRLSFIGIDAFAYRTFAADNNPQNGADHVNFKLANTGEAIGLSQPDSTLIDGISFGDQTPGVSQGRLPDGSANITSFTISQSPGDPNWLPLPNIVINEVLAHTDLPLEDAIEIQNTNAAAVDITGWFLSDAKNNLRRYQITNAITIPSGGFHVFYEAGFNDASMPYSAFALSSAHGDEVLLSAATNGVLTGYRAQVKFDASANGVSFGRYRRSDGQYDFVAMSARTFGADNPGDVVQFRTGTGRTNAYPKVGPVVFSEIMYHPPDLGTNDNTQDEFLELKNLTKSPLNLFDPVYPTNCWRIRGGVDFAFPSGASIGASSTLLVVGFDPVTNTSALAAFKSVYGISNNVVILGPWTGKLDNSGENIELLRPDTPQTAPASDAGFVPFILVEKISYSDTAPWTTNADGTGLSLQRVSLTGYGNDPTNWTAALPTASPTSLADFDGDGMPDSWEDMFGFDKSSPADADQDFDGDGLTNLQEYLAGTDPRDAASRLWLRSLVTTKTDFSFSFLAVSNKTYTVQYRPSLSTGAWQQLQVFPSLPSNRLNFVTNATSDPARFYRLVTP